MAVNTRTIPVSPELLTDVLRDGAAYARWVVGTREICRVDPGFPSPGTGLDVLVGPRPFSAPGRSLVLAYVPGERLVLQASAFLVGTARVVLETTPAGPSATHVRIDERPVERSRWQLVRPLVEVALWLRNVETLRRLEKVALERARPEVASAAPLNA